ncbi:S-layer homology domain-containing protein [Paenibacillus sp. N3.4]|uniref:S-layer homology domain-containing protein n=1 Tax=Paenibacillus sp. N3.4 TaxID=2603222 RepID=UPI00165088ED|nr:glycoside hydrolase family 3 N-terminal domain-containing protein [Paenibacillus sp. N3.4]
MKRSKPLISMLLAILIVLGIAPMNVLAAGYTINYLANGGSGNKADTTDGVAAYTILTNTVAGITYTNHTFVKWNTAANGTSGTDYAAGSTSIVNANLNLYALWSLNAPTSVTASTYDPAQITVTWSGIQNVTHYKIERKNNGADDTTYASLNTDFIGTAYPDTNAVVNAKYDYRVTGIDGSYTALSGITAAASPGMKPAAYVTAAQPSITGYANSGNTIVAGTTITLTADANTSGLPMYYTLDGSTPTTSSSLVPSSNRAITVAPAANRPSPVTLKIVAYNGSQYSSVYSHTLTFKFAVPTDTKAGAYANATYFPTEATISTTANTTVYYTITTDGTEPAAPTLSSPVYSAAIPINAAQTTRIKAFAVGKSTYNGQNIANSDITELTYKVDPTLKSLLALKTGTWTEAQKKVLIQQVISQLTLDEKINLIGGTTGSVADGTAIKNSGAAGGTYTNRRLMSLGIAPITLSDGPAGVRMGYKATTWTSPTAIASSWDDQVMNAIAVQTGKEASFYGVDEMLAPGQNILRNPQSGRNFEYFSEDPYLSGHVAREYTEGVQSQNVGVTVKHFAGNEQETYRSGGNSIVSERALREIYLKGFEISTSAKPWSVMCSYNRLNSIYACSNEWLLTNVLRGDFGFDGYVMSDWGATQGILDAVKAQNDLTESSLSAAKKAELKAAIEGGSFDVKYLNQNVTNLLNVVTKTNTFKGDYGTWGTQYNLTQKEQDFYNSSLFTESNNLARKTAADAMVLLKNNNVLPLAPQSHVGLVTSANLKGRGGFGDNGVTAADFVARGGGSAGVYFDPTHATVVSLEKALQDKFVVANAGSVKDIKQAAGYTKSLSYTQTSNRVTGINLTYSGAFNQGTLDSNAAALVNSTNYGIFVISRQTGEGADNSLTGSDGYNLTDEEQKALVSYATALHNANKKLIVILNIGAALDTNMVNQYADAILVSWLPGQEGGHAITDVLSGAVNPSGKLTQTFTKNFEDSSSIEASKALPIRSGFNMAANSGNAANVGTTNGGWGTNPVFYDEGVLVGYRWFDSKYTTKAAYDAKVAYPFGFGLSYSKFEFSNLKLNKTLFNKNDANDTITATVDVKNVGNVKGKEVAQMYLGMNNFALEGRPMKDLRAYQKVELEPGAVQTLTFTIKLSDLQYYDDGFNNQLSGTETTSNVPYGGGKGWTVNADSTFNVIIGNTSNNYVLNDSAAKQGIKASFVYGTPSSGGSDNGSSSGGVTTPTPSVPEIKEDGTKEKPSTENGSGSSTETAADILKAKFSDVVDIPSWAQQAIADLVKKGIINGKGTNTFEPGSTVTRAEFLKMIVTAFGFTGSADALTFSDVSADAWFKSFVDIATSNGLVDGIGNNQFGPNYSISRQDLSVMIYNALKKQKITLPAADASPAFTDDDAIADYAKEAVHGLKSLGAVNGRSEGEFDPKATATRAEAAVIIKRVLDFMIKPKA